MRVVHVAVHKSVNQHAKDFGVLQQGRDVAKLNAGRRPVGHSADMVAQVFCNVGVLHKVGHQTRAGDSGPQSMGAAVVWALLSPLRKPVRPAISLRRRVFDAARALIIVMRLVAACTAFGGGTSRPA